VRWLSQRTQQTYRLPSEAEWEYAARAETTTRRYWGNDPSQACGYANVAADETAKKVNTVWTVHPCADGYPYTAPVGRFKPNAFGLYDMLGNALEKTEDCYHSTYGGAPDNGASWTAGDCSYRVVRGGSWAEGPRAVRSAFRGWYAARYRSFNDGIRVAKALPQ
jgi:formylglycine-generating enzyme required for sulfatase activity